VAALLLVTALAGCFNPKGNAGGSTDTTESGPGESTTGGPTSTATSTSNTTPPTTLPSQTEATITSEPVTGTATDVTTGVFTSTEPLPPNCGDGQVDSDEDCDDGNDNDNDACLSDCTPANCGDGFLHAGIEECDDGPANANDAPCTASCLANVCGDGLICPACGEECDGGAACEVDKCTFTHRYMFVTSDVYLAEEIGGLEGADTRCNKLVTEQDALVGRNFVAWLSSSTVSAAERIGSTEVEYRRPDNMVIAVGTSDLLNIVTPMQVAIDYNEKGQQVVDGAPVWTGTQADGLKSNASEMCDDWTFLRGTGRKGTMTALDYKWTDDGVEACGEKAHLYCIQVGAVADP